MMPPCHAVAAIDAAATCHAADTLPLEADYASLPPPGEFHDAGDFRGWLLSDIFATPCYAERYAIAAAFSRFSPPPTPLMPLLPPPSPAMITPAYADIAAG